MSVLVHFRETRETKTGERVGIEGTLRFKPTRARIIAGTPDEEVLPHPFTAKTDSDGLASVPLAVTGASWAWEVWFSSPHGRWGPVTVAVSGAGEADWPDLVRVDPDTLAPTAEPEAAWWAAWEAAQVATPATRGLIITDANVATIPAGSTTDNLAAYYNSGASAITVAGVELAAGSHAVWAWVSGAWVLLSSGTGGGGGGVPVLAAPDNLAASVDDALNITTITWTAVPNAVGYYVRLNGGAWADSGADASHTWASLADGAAYTYDVAAYDSDGVAGQSAAGSFTLAAAAAFSAKTDHFAAPLGTLLTAWSGGGITWQAPAGEGAVGSTTGTIVNQRVGNGGAAVTLPAQDACISARYTGGQVRLHARGTGAIVYIQGNGTLQTDTGGSGIVLATGMPTSGTISLAVVGSTATVYINGTQRATFDVVTQSSDRWGFGLPITTTTGIVEAIRIQPWSVDSGIPTDIPSSTAAGEVITSEGFSGVADMTNSPTDASIGGVPFRWLAKEGAIPFTRSGGKAVRSGTVLGSVGFDTPTKDHEIRCELAAIPSTAVRIVARNHTGGDGYSLRITPSAILPVKGSTSAAPGSSTLGAPQVGDIYSVKAVGSTITYTATRGGSTLGTFTFTDATYSTQNVLLVCEGGESTAALDNVVVTAR